MKTIVKGKILETKYYIDDYVYSSLGYIYSKSYFNKKENYENNIKKLKEISDTQWLSTEKVVVDWETFFEADYLDYTLNVGDSIFINDNTYKIERVEGTDSNIIIYYVDNIISEEIDFNSLDNAKFKRKEWQNYLIKENEKYLAELISKEKLEENQKDNMPEKKWYQFWK